MTRHLVTGGSTVTKWRWRELSGSTCRMAAAFQHWLGSERQMSWDHGDRIGGGVEVWGNGGAVGGWSGQLLPCNHNKVSYHGGRALMTHGGNYLYKRPRGKACIVNILMQSVNEMLNEWSNISLFVDSTFFIFKAGLCEIHEVGHCWQTYQRCPVKGTFPMVMEGQSSSTRLSHWLVTVSVCQFPHALSQITFIWPLNHIWTVFVGPGLFRFVLNHRWTIRWMEAK